MSKISLEAPPNTPLEDIPGIVSRVRAAFHDRRSTPFEYRKHQLRRLWWGFKDHEQDVVDALKSDLRKPTHETLHAECIWIRNDILHTIDKMDEWAKDEKVPADMLGMWASPVVRKEPLGAVLIIGAYNYPFQLAICPLIGAIAAGNTAIVKPSELCPASAAVLTKIVNEYLDPEAFAVVNGAVPEVTKLLEEKFDKICYTGSGNVGKIVATAAAKHLTPVLLELGGLNPVIISKNADIQLAAKRVSWGKMLNGGQVCLCPNYAIVPSSKEAEFVKGMDETFKTFFPGGMQTSPDLTRIVNERHFNRIKKMLDETKGEIKLGGKTDEKDLYIDLTLVKVENEEDALMKDEIFGPLLPYIVIDDIDEAIAFVNRVSDTPLALYAFTNDKAEENKILTNTRSGGATINDAIWHAASSYMPFGGVGQSGTGNYRSKAGFDAFTHRRTTAKQPSWMERLIDARYPPYVPTKMAQYRMLMEKSPNFTRDGQTVGTLSSWIGWLFSLGGGDSKTIVAKYVISILGAMYLKNQYERKRLGV